MAKRLFSCTDNESDELVYFSELMDHNNIENYVVQGTAFGLSKPSLWIRNDEDIVKAKQLFKEHEQTFAEQARKKFQDETGYNPDADSSEQWKHFLKNIGRKRAMFPFFILGIAVLYFYFTEFYNLFSVIAR